MELQGPIRVSMTPPVDGAVRSTVELITRSGVYALVVDEDTEFVDEENEPGMLSLGEIYLARTVPIEFPEGTVLRMGQDTVAIVRAVYLERIGPAGEVDPTIEDAQRPRLERTARGQMAALNDVWLKLLGADRYHAPSFELFEGPLGAVCGHRQPIGAAYYCDSTKTLYLDLQTLYDFDQQHPYISSLGFGYLLAHFVGHHVQTHSNVNTNLLTDNDAALPTKPLLHELQADCLAGVAMATMKLPGQPEAGDIAEAMTMAAKIADNALQGAASPRAMPDTLTHGSWDTRFSAFLKGYKAPTTASCM
jgi:predicted metalloprotease